MTKLLVMWSNFIMSSNDKLLHICNVEQFTFKIAPRHKFTMYADLRCFDKLAEHSCLLSKNDKKWHFSIFCFCSIVLLFLCLHLGIFQNETTETQNSIIFKSSNQSNITSSYYKTSFSNSEWFWQTKKFLVYFGINSQMIPLKMRTFLYLSLHSEQSSSPLSKPPLIQKGPQWTLGAVSHNGSSITIWPSIN